MAPPGTPYVSELRRLCDTLDVHITAGDVTGRSLGRDAAAAQDYLTHVTAELKVVSASLGEVVERLGSLRIIAEGALSRSSGASHGEGVVRKFGTGSSARGGSSTSAAGDLGLHIDSKQGLLDGVRALYAALAAAYEAYSLGEGMDATLSKVKNMMSKLEVEVAALEHERVEEVEKKRKRQEMKERKQREKKEREEREVKEREEKIRREQEEKEIKEKERKAMAERIKKEQEEKEKEEKERKEKEEEARRERIRRNPDNWPMYKLTRRYGVYELVPCNDANGCNTTSLLAKWAEGDVDPKLLEFSLASSITASERDSLPSEYREARLLSDVLHVKTPGVYPELPVRLYLKLNAPPPAADDPELLPPVVLQARAGVWTELPGRITSLGALKVVAEYDVSQLRNAMFVVVSPPTEEARIRSRELDHWPVLTYKDRSGIICIVRAREGTIEQKDLSCKRFDWDSSQLDKLGGTFVAMRGEHILSNIVFVENQSVPHMMGDFIVDGRMRQLCLAFPCKQPVAPDSGGSPVVHVSEDLKEWTALDTTTPTIPGFKDLYLGEVKQLHLKRSYFVVTSDFDKDFDESTECDVTPAGGEFSFDSGVKVRVHPNTLLSDASLNTKIRDIPISHASFVSKDNEDAIHGTGPIIDIKLRGEKVITENTINIEMRKPRVLKRFETATENDKMHVVLKLDGEWRACPVMSGKNDNLEVRNGKVSFDASSFSESVLVIQGPGSLEPRVLARTAEQLEEARNRKAVCFLVMLRQQPGNNSLLFACVPNAKVKKELRKAAEQGHHGGPGKVASFLLYDGEMVDVNWSGDVCFKDKHCHSVTTIYSEHNDECRWYRRIICPTDKSQLTHKLLSKRNPGTIPYYGVLQAHLHRTGELLCQCEMEIK